MTPAAQMTDPAVRRHVPASAPSAMRAMEQMHKANGAHASAPPGSTVTAAGAAAAGGSGAPATAAKVGPCRSKSVFKAPGFRA